MGRVGLVSGSGCWCGLGSVLFGWFRISFVCWGGLGSGFFVWFRISFIMDTGCGLGSVLLMKWTLMFIFKEEPDQAGWLFLQFPAPQDLWGSSAGSRQGKELLCSGFHQGAGRLGH